MITHAARSGINWDDDPTFVVMECGAWTMIDDDAGCTPLMDFYLPGQAHKADCPGCRAYLTWKRVDRRVARVLEKIR